MKSYLWSDKSGEVVGGLLPFDEGKCGEIIFIMYLKCLVQNLINFAIVRNDSTVPYVFETKMKFWYYVDYGPEVDSVSNL